jgi:DMSO/TMAO reductase YedYZ heme-binding membrane subunit
MEFITDNLAFILIPFVFMTVSLIGPFLHKHQFIFMSLALIISVIAYRISNDILHNVVFSGQLSLAVFMIVMITGMLPKKSLYRDVLEPVRGDLAIYGFIFLIPHVLNHITPLSSQAILGWIILIIMLPLVITSIHRVKINIPRKQWRQMHKLAYFIYTLLYLHTAFEFHITPEFNILSKPYAWPFHLFTFLYVCIKSMPYILKKIKR